MPPRGITLESAQMKDSTALLKLPYPLYLDMREGALVLERDRHGEKVLRLADGSFLKLFRRKRLISSAAWYPYAKRFADNALALSALGIPCPQVIAVYRIKEISRDAVHYRPLAGQTVRQLIQAGSEPEGLHEHLLEFVARLHEAGVYFRSLHLGNIVLTPENQLGLIDIADLRAHGRPLFAFERRRNMAHLERDPQDMRWLENHRPQTEK